MRHELDRMHLVALATADGQAAQQYTATPATGRLRALDLREPPKFSTSPPRRLTCGCSSP